MTAAATSFLPREHGATAMLLIPFFCAAILAREWRWAELVALIAAFAIFAAKDPLVVLARQRWIWKQPHPETGIARNWVLGEALILAVCGLLLAMFWPIAALVIAGAGAIGFSALAVAINVKNRQRSTVFQILSAFALSATSLAAGLSATGEIQPWCWRLWALCALQATAGILVVHARLEARIGARKAIAVNTACRRPARIAGIALLCASALAAFARQPWIAAALALAGAGYLYDLQRQNSAESLQMPLKRVGQQALSLSIAYGVMVIAGLW